MIIQNKRWITHKEIILPPQAPVEYYSRSRLWNAVELAEKNRDAQLAREVELALPRELSLEENIALVREYVNKNFVSVGMCADIAIHNPPKMNDRHQPINEAGLPTKNFEEMQFINPHAHILLTMRPIGANGKWEAKSQKEYLCIKDGEEKAFTSEEFKCAQILGWEKQYKYYQAEDSKKTIWLTASEGELQCLKRADRSPKSSPYGRKNPTVEKWNAPESVLAWRNAWAEHVNTRLEVNGFNERIDARSFKDRGLEEYIPTVHMGPNAVNIQRRNDRLNAEGKILRDGNNILNTEITSINSEIREHNNLLFFLTSLKGQIQKKINYLKDKFLEIKSKLSFNNTKTLINEQQLEKNYREDVYRGEIVKSEYDRITSENNTSLTIISNLQAQYECTGSLRTRKRLNKDISKEQEKIEARNEYFNEVLIKYGFDDVDEFMSFCKKTEVESLTITSSTETDKALFEQYNTLLSVPELTAGASENRNI